MYEELIQALREHADKMCVTFKDAHACGSDLALEAADAIEELQQTAEHYKGCSDYWYREACDYKAMQSHWIPVEERLPENDTKVLAYYGFDQGDGYLGMMFMRVLDYYANDPVPHFQHEDTYGLTVTHWMPLPEPPKEET